MSESPQIVVIGAGLSGLAAATTILNSGHEVKVFEARLRAGGRVWSTTLEVDGIQHAVERGAEFVLDGYDVFRQYCATYGLSLIDTGMSYYVREPIDRPAVAVDAIARIGKQAAEVARALGGIRSQPISVGDVLRQLDIDPDLRDTLEARVNISTAVRADQVTAKHVLEHLASFEPLPSWRVAGGNQALPNAMAKTVGERIRYGSPVRSVTQDADGVTVLTDSESERFDYAVVALPYAVLTNSGAIYVTIPPHVRDALGAVVQGHAAKLHLGLASRPETSAVMSVNGRYWTWTAKTLDGQVAPVLNCFGGELGHLRRLGVETGSTIWKARVRELRSDLRLTDDEPLLTYWTNDPFARGAYTAHAPGFTDEHSLALATPFGRIALAGEYVEPEFTGLMEGALRSGQRAARGILQLLSSDARVRR